MKTKVVHLLAVIVLGLAFIAGPAAAADKPNILIIWGDDIGAHEDMLPTLLAAAGDTTSKEDLKKGRKIGNMTYKVHLDGYNLLPALKGEGEWPRKEFIYWTDDGSVAALRY